MRVYVLKKRVDHYDAPWFDRSQVFEKGDMVYEYTGATYGCVSDNGVAVTRVPDQTPFIEIPEDALEEVK